MGSRLNKGFRGLWDHVTGKHAKQTRENEREAFTSMRRDRQEKDGLIERHLNERQTYHTLARQVRDAHARDVEHLHRDIADYLQMAPADRPDVGEHFHKGTREQKRTPDSTTKRRGPDRER